MSDAITAVCCTLVIVAGWFYLARSQGVERLQAFETPRRNLTRRRARRMGAWSMMLVGISGFWLIWEVQRLEAERDAPAVRAGLALMVVTVALLTMMTCAFVDVYLTMRMRRNNGRPK
jgi:UDP-N-acetylmuramyl pentapeptide phosphotransferase/UDP-N-acetylglucosamine-1-phosphate transferase